MKLPVYAPIRGFDLDRARLKDEIDNLCLPEAIERSVVFKEGKSVYDTSVDLAIAPKSDLEATTYYREDSQGNRSTVAGKYSTYRVLNLTRIPEDPDTAWLTYLERRGVRIMYWHYYKQPWTWMPQLEGGYIQQVINSFPFEYVQTVRLVSMVPPAIGQVHVDAPRRANNRWLEDGFASITLNVSDGGSHMKFSVGRQILSADPNILVSHFNDSYHHGVPPLASVRHQIRIFGKMDTKTYLRMMDLDHAIWDMESDLAAVPASPP